jgi:4-hydroxy-4-methyl-2-oxoglutarate aldolase
MPDTQKSAAEAIAAAEAGENQRRPKLAAGKLGIDLYTMREPLARAGLTYADDAESEASQPKRRK